MTSRSIPDFDVAGVFQSLANDDFGRAVALAGVFQRDAPRADAVIAIALAVLDDEK